MDIGLNGQWLKHHRTKQGNILILLLNRDNLKSKAVYRPGTQMQARSFHVLPNLVLLSIGKLVFVYIFLGYRREQGGQVGTGGRGILQARALIWFTQKKLFVHHLFLRSKILLYPKCELWCYFTSRKFAYPLCLWSKTLIKEVKFRYFGKKAKMSSSI